MDAAWVLAFLTLVLVVATAHYARTVASQRADALVPLLHWQEPHVALAVDWNRAIARLQLHIVLWNVGPGAARLRLREARSGTLAWTFAHFEQPSIVPSREQLIIQLFRDVPATLSSDGLTMSAAIPRDVTIRVVFEDVVERTNYESTPIVGFDPPSTLPLHVDVPDVPAEPVRGKPGEMLGQELAITSFNPDSRSPSERRVSRELRVGNLRKAARISLMAGLLVLLVGEDWYVRNWEMDRLLAAVEKSETMIVRGRDAVSAARGADRRLAAFEAATPIADAGDEVGLVFIFPWHVFEAEARSKYLAHSDAWVRRMESEARDVPITQAIIDIRLTFRTAHRRLEQAVPIFPLYNIRERVTDVFDD